MGRKLSDWKFNKSANGAESTDREIMNAGHYGDVKDDVAKPGQTSDNFSEDGFRVLDPGVKRTAVKLGAGSAYEDD